MKRQLPNKKRFDPLREIIKENQFNEKELQQKSIQEEKEIEEVKKEKSNKRFNRFNMAATVVFGLLTSILAWQANEMNKVTVNLAARADSTSLDIVHFNQLLEQVSSLLTSDSIQNEYLATQVDTSTEIRRRMGKVFNALLDQKNFYALEKTQKNLNEYREKAYKYNEFSFLLANLEPILYRYTVIKAGQPVKPIIDISKRVESLQGIENALMKMQNINYLFESEDIINKYSAVLTAAVTLKLHYTHLLYYERFIDTTSDGNSKYETTMNSISDFRELVYSNLKEAMDKNEKKLHETKKDEEKSMKDLRKIGLIY